MTTKQSTIQSEAKLRGIFEKIVVNAGVGRASAQAQFEEKVLPQIRRDLNAMAGQASHLRPSRKSIAGFKMREGQTVGLRITLRKKKMVDFFTRLITIVLPRVRDFSGIDMKAVDEGGVLNIGFKEQFVFPEINPEESAFIFPLGVNIVPRAKDRAKAIELYKELGVPFKKTQSKK